MIDGIKEGRIEVFFSRKKVGGAGGFVNFEISDEGLICVGGIKLNDH
jgi:hypothetical protein